MSTRRRQKADTRYSVSPTLGFTVTVPMYNNDESETETFKFEPEDEGYTVTAPCGEGHTFCNVKALRYFAQAILDNTKE